MINPVGFRVAHDRGWACRRACVGYKDQALRLRTNSGCVSFMLRSRRQNLRPSLHHRRFLIRRLLLVRMNLSVLIRKERAMLRVECIRDHGQNEAILLAFEANVIISTIGIDHALCKRPCVDEFGKSFRIMPILLIEVVLRTNYDPHIGESLGFRIRAGWISGKLRLVSGCGLTAQCRGGRQES